MGKENLAMPNGGQPIARVTRSQAKRKALGEINTNVAAPGQNKKRAAFKDVTNVFCANSYNNCLNAPKVKKSITTQKIKKCSSKVSKVAPSDAENVGQLLADTRAKGGQEIAKTETNLSKNELVQKVESNKSIPLSDDGAQGSRQIELGMSSKALIFSVKGKNADKIGIFGQLLMSQTPDTDVTEVKDVDSDLKDPLLCSSYAPDIYVNLRVAELIRRPIGDFMETVQRDISQSMRGILIDWLVEVSQEYKLVPDTLYLTVHLIDLYLSQNYIERQRLQLLGITCMLIASKYEEICAPRVEEFCFITDNTYSKEEVLELERKVLNNLGFRLSVPTAKTFLRRYLRVAQNSYETSSLDLEFLANYLAELTLIDYELLKFPPSIIAASAVFLARWTLNQSGYPWNVTLEFYTRYKASDLKTIVFKLQSLQMNTAGCPLNAIRAKYKQDKFKAVAALSSPELLQTLF